MPSLLIHGVPLTVGVTCLCLQFEMFQNFAAKTETQKLWIWRLEYLHHEQRPLYFGEWF